MFTGNDLPDLNGVFRLAAIGGAAVILAASAAAVFVSYLIYHGALAVFGG